MLIRPDTSVQNQLVQATRNECPDTKCLLDAYDSRIAELSIKEAVHAFLTAKNSKDVSDCARFAPPQAHQQDFFDIGEARLAGSSDAEYIGLERGSCLCSPTGTCALTVVVPYQGSFRTLLEVGAVQDFEVLRVTNASYPDLETSQHGSAFESTHRVYRFDGTRYRRVSCTEWNYQDEKNQKVILKALELLGASNYLAIAL